MTLSVIVRPLVEGSRAEVRGDAMLADLTKPAPSLSLDYFTTFQSSLPRHNYKYEIGPSSMKN